MEYVAFDLEIAKELPEGCEDWKAHRPLGISCAVTLAVSPEAEGERTERRWHGAEQADGRLADRMTPQECQALADYLLMKKSQGYQIVTWNGLGFDFDVLAEEVNDLDVWQALRDLALVHVDPAFQMLCEKGFMCGLEAAAQGLGVGKKFEDVHGADAPVLWKQERDDQDRVLDYCAQDVALTAAVHDEIVKRRYLTWIRKDGRVSSPWRPTFYTPTEMAADRRLLTVTEALALPLPDTSWMDKPWSRSKFLGWTERPPGQETSNLSIEGVTVTKAPMVKISRDLTQWASPADQLTLPIEEEVSNG